MPQQSESSPLLGQADSTPSICRYVASFFRSVFLLVASFVLLVIFLIIVFVACLCIPFICCCFCCCRFDSETLDGATAEPDADTEKEIQEARASPSPYHADIEYFAQLGETLHRHLTREVTIQIDDPAPGADVPAKRELLLETLTKRTNRPFAVTIQIDREHIVQQTLRCLCSVPAMRLLARGLFFVQFKGEAGVDAGGLRRDFFDTMGRKLAEEAEGDNGRLMALADKTLFPRPYEERSMDLLAIGRLAGLAVFYGTPLPIPLGSVACKLLLEEAISPKDVQRLDPDFYQFRVKPVLKPGGVGVLEAALCEPLMFVSAPTALRESKELCPGGAEKRVTEGNKEEYIRLLCQYHLIGDREDQIKIFLQGFWDIFPKDSLAAAGVTYRELALLIAGYSVIDPLQWRTHTLVNVSGCYAELIEWFWQMVLGMSEEDRAKLLHFVTGSSRLPSSGFAGLQPSFNIAVEPGEEDHLPQSHTCGNQLVLPSYSSKEMLVEKMQIAIANDEGFGFA